MTMRGRMRWGWVERVLLLAFGFALAGLLGAGGVQRPAPGFALVGYGSGRVIVWTVDGKKWDARLEPGCGFVVFPRPLGQMPKLEAVSDSTLPWRTDEDCRDLYRRPRRRDAGTDR